MLVPILQFQGLNPSIIRLGDKIWFSTVSLLRPGNDQRPCLVSIRKLEFPDGNTWISEQSSRQKPFLKGFLAIGDSRQMCVLLRKGPFRMRTI
jgi:hypothetical protein